MKRPRVGFIAGRVGENRQPEVGYRLSGGLHVCFDKRGKIMQYNPAVVGIISFGEYDMTAGGGQCYICIFSVSLYFYVSDSGRNRYVWWGVYDSVCHV